MNFILSQHDRFIGRNRMSIENNEKDLHDKRFAHCDERQRQKKKHQRFAQFRCHSIAFEIIIIIVEKIDCWDWLFHWHLFLPSLLCIQKKMRFLFFFYLAHNDVILRNIFFFCVRIPRNSYKMMRFTLSHFFVEQFNVYQRRRQKKNKYKFLFSKKYRYISGFNSTQKTIKKNLLSFLFFFYQTTNKIHNQLTAHFSIV